jgi:hypothetical protein
MLGLFLNFRQYPLVLWVWARRSGVCFLGGESNILLLLKFKLAQGHT